MGARVVPLPVTDKDVRALLERYACPVPFHEVRTRFLGNIAAPAVPVAPVKMIESLWGGELPEFETLEAANVMIEALIVGLWNRLARHQDQGDPFRLVPLSVATTRGGLTTVALTRRQEIDGFIQGLFGSKEAIDLPERAHHGVSVLGEMRALIAGVQNVAADQTKTATAGNIEGTLRQMAELTTIAEEEINAVVLSCTRARRQSPTTAPVGKPTLH